MSSEWISADEARRLPGLRLALTAGVPGPWSEAAKAVFHVKGIPFARVKQQGGASNDELHAWTGHRNAPVAVYDDEHPRTGWAEILWLAERLCPEPALVPADAEQRALCFGLAHELMGENGLGWCRRLMIFRSALGDAAEPPEALRPLLARMIKQYRYSPAAADAAPARAAQILSHFSRRLLAQREAGIDFLLGKSLSAVDLYWSAMAAMLKPLPPELCAMPEALRASYASLPDELAEAVDPALLEHRDRIYRNHLELPIAL